MVYSKKEFDHIINEWIGIPYLHAGQTKSAGVDCVNLLLGIYNDLGMINKNEIKYDPYPPDWHLHQKEEKLLNIVKQYCQEIQKDFLQYGDLVLMKFGQCFSHGAIYIGNNEIIHAVINKGVIISNLLHRYWKNREHKYFRLLGY